MTQFHQRSIGRCVSGVIIAAAAHLLITACGQITPTEGVVATLSPASPSPRALPSTGVRPNAAALLTAEATAGPPTAMAGVAVATPDPGQAFPVWWTVRPETAADGRTVYRVNEPEVKATIETQYREMLAFFANQSGLSDLNMASLYAVEEEMPAREASRSTAIAQGAYWRTPIIQTLNWRGEPEFSSDGSAVTLTYVIDEAQVSRENLYYERVDIATGKVVGAVRMPPMWVTVTLRYDSQQGRWRHTNGRSEYLVTPIAGG